MDKPEYAWPVRPFNVVLVEPEIPPNTGNIARLCAATGTHLHLVGQLGFRLGDSAVRRAGLDYWDSVRLTRHSTLEVCRAALPGVRFFLFSVHGDRLYTDVSYAEGDAIVFGSETGGLPAELLEANRELVLTIPMLGTKVRSLNLANCVSITLYEALRQIRVRASPVAAGCSDAVRRNPHSEGHT